jgi:hypothetical protein
LREKLPVILKGENHVGRLTIQSIEGPGGISKPYHLDHVDHAITSTDLAAQHYLKLHLWAYPRARCDAAKETGLAPNDLSGGVLVIERAGA